MKKVNPNLIVAKMDATANDIHPIFGQLKGYPTIFFMPVAHKREPVQYQSGFDYKSLKAFVEQQASVILTDEERMGLPSASESQEKESNADHPAEQEAEQKTHKADEL